MTEEWKKYHRDWYHANKNIVGPRKAARDKKQRRFLSRVKDEIKLFRGCSNCGYDEHARALDFHHVERGSKSFEVSSGVGTSMGLSKFLSEIDKCDVLCANCHRVKTHEERVCIGKSDNGSLRALEA